jgi:hypothetical protein
MRTRCTGSICAESKNMNEAAIKAVIEEQANDYGLWFRAETCAEAYLQQALRRLHAVIEGIVEHETKNEAI